MTAAGRFDGRVVVVTGAGAGIGAAVADRVLAEGGRVAGLDVAPGPATGGTGDLLRLRCDVTDRSAVQAAVAAAAEAFGRIDGLVNCAGVNAGFDPLEMTEPEWDALMGVDLKAAWLCVQAAVPHLRRSGGGAIVNITSLHGRLTTAGTFPYAAAKAGLEGLTRSLALELAPAGTRVNAVAPGWTRTRLVEQWLEQQPDPVAAQERLIAAHPLGRIAEPAEVAAVVVFALSEDAAAMTGAVLNVDGGLGIRFSVD